ncbi:MAG TPA: PDDEXK nuclease domain-containing protein [Chitinophagaceae bacterium]|nr:PDDEXK nuclease domain-containing protein [Chitinophagaceae bacterium]
MNKNQIKDRLFNSIKVLIEEAKDQIVRNVNSVIVYTNFEIGKKIVENEQRGKERAGYAEKTLIQLSTGLTAEYGRGYSPSNLEYMRKFYLLYKNRISQPSSGKSGTSKKSQPVAGNSGISLQLSWSHYVHLLRIEDENERNFYEIESIQNNWGKRELIRQYNSSLYERIALSKDKNAVKELGKKGQIIEKPTDALKHHTVLEFLDLREDESYSESDLENEIISKLEHFILELGKGFLFESRQKRFTFDGDCFFVDLVLYNRLLKCYVLIDLKIGKLTHQDIGQMQMYVNYCDRKIKLPGENSTIGIILCKEDNKTVVEFTLPKDNKTIFAKEYKLYLPSKEQLKKQLE